LAQAAATFEPCDLTSSACGTMPDIAGVSALAVPTAADQKQLAIKAQRYALADHALNVCGLMRPGCENEAAQQPDNFLTAVDDDSIIQMKDVVRTRGVKKRLEDDFGLLIGNGEPLGEIVPEKETEAQFLSRTILQLRRQVVKDVIKLFDRVEKNNRKAASNDAAWRVQLVHYRGKVAADDDEEWADDIEHGTVHRGSPEYYAEIEDWFAQYEYRDGEQDFCAFAGSDVTRGDKLQPDDGTFAGFDLTKIRDALQYFQANSNPEDASGKLLFSFQEHPGNGTAQDGPTVLGPEAEAAKTEPVKTMRLDANVVKAELAKWSPALIVSAYRRLSLIKHPDKEGGSPEAFQDLTDHAKVLTEACAKFHGISIKKGVSAKKKGAAAPFAKGGPKLAICVELPAHLKGAVEFFSFSEDSFRCGSPAEIKRLRLVLSAEKERREKQIQREKEPEKLIDILQTAGPSPQEGEEPEDFSTKNLKQLKTLCVNLCKTHYASIYAHIQKLK